MLCIRYVIIQVRNCYHQNYKIITELHRFIASAILDNNSLVLIDLSGNNISDEGVGDLCKVIPYNRTLAQLNLADNKLGDSSVSKLAGSLVDNTSLVHINLSGNFIGDDGALSLFKV